MLVPRRPGRESRAYARAVAMPVVAVGIVLVLSSCGAVLASPPSPSPSVSSGKQSPSSAPGLEAPTPAAAVAAAVPAAKPHPEVVLALGDSVPAGMACGCQPYVALIAGQMSRRIAAPVTAVNDAVSGSTSAGLLASLGGGSSMAADVARADAVIITTGANDFVPPSGGAATCVTATSCYQDTLTHLTSNVTAIIARLRALRHGPPAILVVTGYWNIWQDGTVGAQKGADFVQLSRAATSAANSVLQQVSTAQDVSYVDLVPSFLGPNDDDDDTALLAPDGDHPDAAGHQLIATAILRAVPSLLRPLP